MGMCSCCFTDKCCCAWVHLRKEIIVYSTEAVTAGDPPCCTRGAGPKISAVTGFLAVGPLHARLTKGLSTSSWLLLRTYTLSQTLTLAKCQMSVNYEWNTWLCPNLRGTSLLLTPCKSLKQRGKSSFYTSYLVGDMLFRCDNLVHVSSKPGIQRDSLHFAWFHQLFILSSGVTQDLSVHRIRDLQGESFSNVWFVFILQLLRIQSSRAVLGISGDSVV